MTYKCINCGINNVQYEGDICSLCSGKQSSAFRYKEFDYIEDDEIDIFKKYCDDTTLKDSSFDDYDEGEYDSHFDREKGLLTEKKNHIRKSKSQIIHSVSQDDSGIVSKLKNRTYRNTDYSKRNSFLNINKEIVSCGIVKNINVDKEKTPFIIRLLKSMLAFVPLSIFDDITVFQVFPDYIGQSTNSNGFQCDQIMVYGNVNRGQISENNTVEVYGYRDNNNIIIARKIINTTSGAIITPTAAVGPAFLWIVALFVLSMCIGIVSSLGLKGIIIAAIITLCFLNLGLTVRIIGYLFRIALAAIGYVLKLFFR